MIEFGYLALAAAQTETYLLMKDNGSGALTPTTALVDIPYGVSPEEGAASDKRQIKAGQLIKLRASGSISIGDYLIPSATSGDEGYAKAGTNGFVIGRAVTACSDQNTFWAVVGDLTARRGLTITVGTEAADVITVTLQQNIASADPWEAELFLSTGIEATAAAFHLGESGAGAEVTTTDNSRLIFTVSAAGAASLEVTDVGGASGATVYLKLTPLNGVGLIHYQAITFD